MTRASPRSVAQPCFAISLDRPTWRPGWTPKTGATSSAHIWTTHLKRWRGLVAMSLILTLALSMITFTSGRTNMLQGVVHLQLFAAYILLIFQA
jgi:hypothetical protein